MTDLAAPKIRAWKEPSFTVGVEEEYFIVDPETRNLASAPPPELLDECIALREGQVTPEFLRAQIEVGTKPYGTIPEVREDLAGLRSCIKKTAQSHGLDLVAASTHPFAQWSEQKHVDKDRYNELARELKTVVRRLVICGMHVHVGIEDEDLRIDLMNQVRYFLPHLLMMSASSPFWRGEETGLRSYRVSVWKELPRTGLPETFDSWGEYRRHVDVLVDSGVLEDATKIWWDIRPSDKFPTLEMRMTDVCTTLDDAMSIAAMLQCLLSMLFRLRRSNQRWRTYSRFLIEENRWRGQRYGMTDEMIDFGKGCLMPMQELTEELIELTREDAERLGCVDQLLGVRDIARRGSSADRQLAIYHEAVGKGAEPAEALKEVVDWLIAETARGVPT